MCVRVCVSYSLFLTRPSFSLSNPFISFAISLFALLFPFHYYHQLANQLTEQDSKIANLKAAFARIKMETGESNIDRIVHKFLTREETHEGILQEIENINERIELANTENQHLKTQLDQSGGISRSGISRSLYKNVDKLQEEVKREKRREEDAMRRATEADCVLQELKHSVKRFLLKVSIVNAPPQPREGHAHLDHVQVKRHFFPPSLPSVRKRPFLYFLKICTRFSFFLFISLLSFPNQHKPCRWPLRTRKTNT